MSDVNIDAATFKKRVHILQRKLSNNDPAFNEANSILVVTGKAQDSPYMKSAIIHSWLIGYEFPSTGLLITKDKVVFITSSQKAKHLTRLEGKDCLLLSRTKEPDHNKKLFDEFIGHIEEAGKTIGTFQKDVHEGAFVQEWKAAFDNSGKDFKQVDVAGGLSQCLQVKDEEELRSIRTAAKASDKLIKYFADQMSRAIDAEKKISHSKFSEQVEDKISDDKYMKNLKISSEFDPEQVEWSYNPIIQSGGKYDLRPSAASDDNRLTAGVILCQLGLRYKSYCSNVGRTYLIDPTKRQEGHYNFLVSLQRKVVEMIKDGAVCKDIYSKALDIVKDKAPDLESHFLKNIGSGIGIDFRDTSLLLNAKNPTVLKEGMTLNVSVGFQDVKNPDGKGKDASYSMVLSDTVRVGDDSAVVFTDSEKGLSNVSYYFKDDEVDAQPVKREKAPHGKSAILKTRLRNENKASDDTEKERRRQEHQKVLHEKLQKQGLERFAGTDAGDSSENKQVFKKYESYKRDTQLPANVKDLRVSVDVRSQTIIIPINGRPVPFHINSFKNGSKNDEGEYVYIRLNFHSPGQGSTKKDDVPFEDPNAQFLKSITLRSRDTDRMNEVFKRITDLKKEALKRESERKEMADVVQQDKLIEMRQRRPLRLDSVFVRPGPEGKRVAGSLEVHQNGVRYSAPGGPDSKIDVLFSNVKHLFYQPCDHELIVIIHMHLKNPIIVGKRKTYDVQFYRETSDVQFDETGNKKRRYRYGDEDELEAEQEDRKRRQALNKEFKNFAEKISEASGGSIDLDIPMRELGFYGVPQRSNVYLQPTTDCLIQLTEQPFLVITINEIEVCHLERVAFGLKQFDLVFVFKDFSRVPSAINSIPMDQLDAVKDWLNELDIPYHENPNNLNWVNIMKTVNADPNEFFKGGGWSFLGGDDDEANESEESEPESEFNPSEEDPSDEDDDEGDYEDEYEEEDSGSEGYDDDSEEGEDWDELEEKAKKSDAKREDGGGGGASNGKKRKR